MSSMYVVLVVGVGVEVLLNGFANCTAELHLLAADVSLVLSNCCCIFVMSSIRVANFCSKISFCLVFSCCCS